MQTRGGFTIIEVLFCLSVVIILSSLTLGYFINRGHLITFENQYTQIQSIIEEAKIQALKNHKRVDLVINNNSIGYSGQLQKNRNLKLSKEYYFTSIKEIYFNENGNINQGNHIKLCNNDLCKKIIFNVGSGNFYVEQ